MQDAKDAEIESVKEDHAAECARLVADAKDRALMLVKTATAQAREEEKAAMERVHTFQQNKIFLDVGGHKFTTSLQTLTSVPDTYLSSMFSGRFALGLDNDGAYCIDRDGTHFRHILN